MRIRNILLACIGFLGLFATLSSAWLALDAVELRRSIQASVSAAKGLGATMVLSERISAVRSRTSTLFADPQPATRETLLPFDTAIEKLEAAFEAMRPFAGPDWTALRQAMQDIRDREKDVIRAVELPSAVRPVAVDRALVLAADRMQSLLSSVADTGELDLVNYSPLYGRYVQLARLAQSLREAAGFRSALLSPSIDPRVPLKSLRELDELSGRVSLLWQRIQLSVNQLSDPPEGVKNAYETVSKTIMGEGEARWRSIITKLGSGQPLDITPGQYRAWTSPMLNNAFLLRDAVFDELKVRFAVDETKVAWQLCFALASALLAAAATVGAIWVVIVRVAVPLTRLTQAVTKISQDELDAEIPGTDRGDELGNMARALLVLRDMSREVSRLRSIADGEQRANIKIARLVDGAEINRIAKEQAERSDRAKTRFIAAASHDLRQPIQGAMLFLEAARIECLPYPNAREIISKAAWAISELKQLTDSLMDLSRADTDTSPAEITDFEISALIEQVVASSTVSASAKGLAIETIHCPAVVRTDQVLLGRMLRNLVENAVRYTEKGTVSILWSTAGDKLRIEIRDTGRGIAEADLSIIFEEFRQLPDAPELYRRLGLGLGLSIVRRLGLLLGHPVGVTSVVGQGTSFTVDVPLSERPGVTVPPPVAEITDDGADTCPSLCPRREGMPRAMVIDDDPDILKGLSAVLSASGYEVYPASGRVAAVDLVTGGADPDIIVADYRLRDGTGSDVIDRIREVSGRKLPGVLLTGEVSQAPEAEANRLGMFLLRKPASITQLRAALAGMV